MRRVIVVVSAVWVVLFAAFLYQFNHPKTEIEGLSQQIVTPVYSVKQPMPITLPVKISGTELTLHAIITTKDGKCWALVENVGVYPVERAHISIGLSSKVMKFITGNIAPGERITAEGKDGLCYNSEPILYCYGTQFLDLYLNQ